MTAVYDPRASTDKATAWLTRLHDWHTVYGHLVRARTYRTQLEFVPGWVRPGRAPARSANV